MKPFLLSIAALTALSASTSVLAQSSASSPYVLSPDDQICISVLGHDDLKETITILPDGTCRYPIVGSLHAAGMTVDGLTQALTRRLSDQFNQPQVTVSVTQSRPQRVSVLGAVKTSGQFDVHPGTHLLDVLAEAGGPAQDATLTEATLVTDDGSKSIAVDIAGLLAGTDPSQNLPLEAGDVLLVQARDVSYSQAQALGEVVKPGAISVPPEGLPVSAVLAQAGGATAQACLTQAQLLHGGHAVTLNLRPLLSNLNDPAGQTRVMPGDVFLVPANAARVAVLGEVHSPAIYTIPDGGSLSVASALALAGGATSDGDAKNADVVRRDADGMASVTHINLEALMKGTAGAFDLPLEPGDILFVPARHQGSSFNAENLLTLVPLVGVFAR